MPGGGAGLETKPRACVYPIQCRTHCGVRPNMPAIQTSPRFWSSSSLSQICALVNLAKRLIPLSHS
jgi:hypothetical protein